MAVVVTVPWTRTEMGVTVLVCAGYDSLRVSERLGKRHKTIGMWAHQMISEGRVDGFPTGLSS
jgi:hypothetical protein